MTSVEECVSCSAPVNFIQITRPFQLFVEAIVVIVVVPVTLMKLPSASGVIVVEDASCVPVETCCFIMAWIDRRKSSAEVPILSDPAGELLAAVVLMSAIVVGTAMRFSFIVFRASLVDFAVLLH